MPELDPVLNRALLPGNTCFGCGHHNAAGLHIDVVRDPEEAQVLRGRFEPTADMIGFPGIVHGGAIFTALDCLSTWVAIVLGPNREAAWVLRSAWPPQHWIGLRLRSLWSDRDWCVGVRRAVPTTPARWATGRAPRARTRCAARASAGAGS